MASRSRRLDRWSSNPKNIKLLARSVDARIFNHRWTQINTDGFDSLERMRARSLLIFRRGSARKKPRPGVRGNHGRSDGEKIAPTINEPAL